MKTKGKVRYYQILKYKPEKYVAQKWYECKGYTYFNPIYSEPEEWTDSSDIWAEDPDTRVSVEEYLRVERGYINIVRAILDACNVAYLYLTAFMAFDDDMDYNLKRYNLENDINFEKKIRRIQSLKLGDIVTYEMIPDLIKALFRNFVYCKLGNNKKKLKFGLDYDLYFWVETCLDENTIREIVESNGLFLDPRHAAWEESLRLEKEYNDARGVKRPE